MQTPPFPDKTTTLLLDGPAGTLEVVVDPATGPALIRPVIAVVCHPLSIEGGSLNNKVVTQTARALRDLGLSTVRFNFRSVGASQGRFDAGEGEQDDLRCVVQWVRQHCSDSALWLVGFSFGAYVSLRACATLQPQALISIAPPIGRGFWDFGEVQTPAHWLVIQGDDDEIIDAKAVHAWLDQQNPAPQRVRMPQTSHFFHGKLLDLRTAIQREVQPWLLEH